MSLVGIRPKSEEEWRIFPPEHKEHALKYKPRLIGVGYANPNPTRLEDLIKTEKNYLQEKEKSPVFTDIKYLF